MKIDYSTWKITLKTLLKQPKNEIILTENENLLEEHLKLLTNDKMTISLLPSHSEFLSDLQTILLPILPIFSDKSPVLSQTLLIVKNFIQDNGHILDSFAAILPEILMSLIVSTRLKKSTVQLVVKTYLRKTRDFDGIYRSYLAVLEGQSLNTQTNRKDHGVKQSERVKAINMLMEILNLDGGKVLVQGVNENKVDTGFYQLRQIIETVLSFQKQSHINLTVKDASRQALVKLI